MVGFLSLPANKELGPVQFRGKWCLREGIVTINDLTCFFSTGDIDQYKLFELFSNGVLKVKVSLSHTHTQRKENNKR